MITFPLNEKRFSFFVADHLLIGQWCTNSKAIGAFYHVWKWHNVQRAKSEMRHCTNHALYRSKLWQQDHCQHPQNANADCQGRAQGDENKVSGYGYGLWCGFRWGPHHATSHLRSRLERQLQSVPGCVEKCGDLLVQSSGRWHTLGVAAGLDAGPQVQRDPGLTSDGVLRLCTLLSLAPPPRPTWTRWTTSFGHTSRTSPTWSSRTPKSPWSLPSAEYSPSSRWRLWKRHSPSSRSVSRQWLRLKVATLNRCQFYYITMNWFFK